MMNRILFMMIIMLSVSCNQGTKIEEKNASDTPFTTPNIPVLQPKNEEVNPILSIRKMVTHINTTTLVKEHVEFMCDEQTKVDFFSENDEIVKISIDFGTVGDVYAKEDYYYSKGKLIFFYEFVEGGPACEGCIKTNEYRSYIKNDKVIKYLKDKNQEQCRKCEFRSSSRQYQLLKARTQEEIKRIICKQ